MTTTNWQLAGRRAFYTRLRRKGLNDWHAKEIAGLLEKKQPERERILTFLSDHVMGASPHFLTLPGSQFALEKMLKGSFAKATFTCLERDRKVVKIAFDHYSKNAPGRGRLRSDDGTVYTNGTTDLIVDDASKIGEHTLRALLSGGWYDGMGLLNADEFAVFLKGLRVHLPREGSIPFVFTLQIGRDSNAFYNKVPGDSLSKRVRKLRTLLREAGIGCEVQEFWSYDSDSNGPLRMMNVCCHLSRTPVGRKTAWDIISYQQMSMLRDRLGAHKLARMLGTTTKTVADWAEDRIADEVAQIELLELVEAGYEAGQVGAPAPVQPVLAINLVSKATTVEPDAVTKEQLIETLRANGNSPKDAAETLGVSRRTIYNWRKKFGILGEKF